jgi:uncharacterized membrane protein YraQ (UPF0718 family)
MLIGTNMSGQPADLTTESVTAAESTRTSPSSLMVAALVFFGLVAALVTYKVSGSLGTIAKVRTSHVLAPRADWLKTDGLSGLERPLLRTVNYLAVVWPALAFGVVIAGAVRALIPAAWVVRVLGGPPARAQLLGGLVGAPLMLCSCCVAPVFDAVQRRTNRTGPASALLLASPSLNPAALALTFMLFTTEIAVARLIAAAVLVFGVTAFAARALPPPKGGVEACSLEVSGPGAYGVLSSFAREVAKSARMTLPALVAGIVLSSVAVEIVPVDHLTQAPLRIAVVVLVALVSVPLALPTFAEIPLALGLLAAGAPAGAALALMVAGPAVNLPSLLTVARTTSPLHAAALGIGTLAAAAVSGLLV